MSLLQQRRKSRISLSDIDELARTGKVQLTPNEIQLFHKKGILKTTMLPTPPLTTINEVTAPASNSLLIVQASNSSSTATANTLDTFNTPSVPSATSVSPTSTSSSSPSPSPLVDDRDLSDSRTKRSAHQVGLLSPQRQTARLFHRNTFENTTSHLFPEATLTAESSLSPWRRHSTANALQAVPTTPKQPSDLTVTRRSSTSVIPSVVSTPLGVQTVLYAASSPAHTLYSLPYQISAPVVPEGGTPVQPRKPAYNPPSPVSPTRGRKKSVPHRSPNANDPQDDSPGIVFQLPFGHWSPPVTAKASRENSLASSFSSSTTEITIRPPSPPIRTPSPGSTSAATIVMESSSSSSQNSIRVTIADQASSTERIAVTATATTATATTIAATPIATANITTTASETTSTSESVIAASVEPSGLGIRVDNMPPTPPTTICPEAALTEGTPAPSSLSLTSAPWTPVTPSNGFAPSALTSDIVDPIHQSTVQDIARARDSSSPAAAEDPTQLPLRAQRQLSIRRQSLLPRPELDFVNGSGILPPASQNLDTRGGAHILSYPVLLSDMVQVAMDGAHARELEAHTDDVDSETGAPTSCQRHHGKSAPKRKRGGKKRGSISAHGAAHGDEEESYHDGEAAPEFNNKRRRSSQAIPASDFATSNHVNSTKSTRGLALGSPVAISSSPKTGRSNARGGKLGRPRKPKMTGHRADSYDDAERLDQTFEPSPTFKPQPSEIPPEEVELALQYTREMVMHQEANVSSDGIHYHPTTLQPLLDATRHLKEQEGYFDSQQPHPHQCQLHIHQHHHHHHTHHQQQQQHEHHHHYAPGGRYKQSPADDEETEDELRPVRTTRGHSHLTYPGESDYYDEDELSHAEDVGDSGSAREVSPVKNGGGKTGQAKAPKSASKSRVSKAKTGENSEASSLKRKRQNKEANSTESSNAGLANKKRRPSSTAVSGFSSAAYAQQQKAKSEGRMGGTAGTSAGGPSKEGGKESSGRSSKTGEKKTCLACKIQDTPCWRPSYKEGTSLCNSCGLRYKKVGVICLNTDCNYIPIKSEYANMEAERQRSHNPHLKCLRCENVVYQPAGKKATSASAPASSSITASH
ncbi:DNA-binding transcription repressor [Actinomortierella ambigua]|uniref:DNA-binding transcription repressor n=1 Tax=Actinomortierella ambigua TaxID=1343610 RepID=A0A9P6QP66_9FUNG|nr:DNA-binding transcription repressor [Actinomortierella ambigua]